MFWNMAVKSSIFDAYLSNLSAVLRKLNKLRAFLQHLAFHDFIGSSVREG